MVLDRFTQLGKIGFACFVIGTVFFVIGFSVPFWLLYDQGAYEIRIGLWETCWANGDTQCYSNLGDSTRRVGRLDYRNSDWFRGTQALACLCLIALIIDWVVRILYICGKPKKFLLVSVILDICASALAFLAAVVFGSKTEDWVTHQLHFGFAFDIIGAIFLGGAAICLLMEYCRR